MVDVATERTLEYPGEAVEYVPGRRLVTRPPRRNARPGSEVAACAILYEFI
jgi:hypothetical protein